MIPTKPPPTFRKPEKWSDDFIDFVTKCLVKIPDDRASATQLLQVTLDVFLIAATSRRYQVLSYLLLPRPLKLSAVDG